MSNQKLPPFDVWSLSISNRVPHHPTIPQVISDHSGLSSARIMVGLLSQNPHHPWYFLLVLSHPWASPCFKRGYQSPLVHAVFRVEPHLSLPLYNPTAEVPITMNKVCLIIFHKSHWTFFSLTVQIAGLQQGWNEVRGDKVPKRTWDCSPLLALER